MLSDTYNLLFQRVSKFSLGLLLVVVREDNRCIYQYLGGSMLQKKGTIIMVVLLLFLLPLGTLRAAGTGTDYSGQDAGPAFYAQEKIEVNGVVNGDLYAAGKDVIINATVVGDVIAAGQNLTINGPVQGDVRLAGQNITLKSNVRGSATTFSQELIIDESASIGRDLVAAAANAYVDGKVAGKMFGAMEGLYVSGINGNDLLLQAKQVQLEQGATVGGDLIYTSEKKAKILPGAQLKGQEKWTQKETAAAGKAPT